MGAENINTKKPKIGIVCPYNINKFGGVVDHVKSVAAILKSRGYVVKIVTPTPPGADASCDPDVIYVGSSRAVNAPFLNTTPQLSVSTTPDDVKQMYDQERFDIMHFHEPWVPVLSGQLLAYSNSINVATFHAKMPEDLLSKSLEKIWLPYGKNVSKHIHYITAVSEVAARYVRTATDQEIEIIPNGIILDKFDPAKVEPYVPFADDVKTILFIGRLEGRKGVSHLLKAYKEFSSLHKNVRLVIAGDGPKRRTLQNYVERNKLPMVSFLGFVSEEDKLALMKAADLMVSPAMFGESFGIVLIEAMAMKLPIIGGNNAGYSSVMKDTGRLALFDPKSTLSFVHKMELMLFDDEVRDLFIRWASSYVKQFDYSIVTDSYVKVYEGLYGQGN